VAELTLYQAEWCPFSSAVREVLTELGLDFVARQVEPWPVDRAELRRVAGTDEIPTLHTEDGTFHVGTRAIFAHLREREPGRFAAAHRRRFLAHHPARASDVPAQLLEYFDGAGELESADGTPEYAVVLDAPERSRYELRLGGRLIGVTAYHLRGDRIAFTHTEVAEECEGRGFGSKLAAEALANARARGLEIVALCPFVAHYLERHPELAASR
jgi:uncharacterized protein